jgi:hypothetical protein
MKSTYNALIQEDAAMSYIKKHGSMIPARMIGKVYAGTFLGSEITRACRSLRAKGYLKSKIVDRFAVFTLTQKKYKRI